MNHDKVNLILENIKKLQETKKFIVIAIDGNTCSGKTTIANELKDSLKARVIHCDHFFLPLNLRSKERLEEPGGNIHYERMKSEVIDKLNTDIEYKPFMCKNMDYGDAIHLELNPITIVEGSYSLHPYFGKYYDLSIFLTIDKEEQIKRLKIRCPDKLNAFIEKWIPLEAKYHNILDMNQINLVLK